MPAKIPGSSKEKSQATSYSSAYPGVGRELTLLWAAAILLQYLSQLDWIRTVLNDPLSTKGIIQSALFLVASWTLVAPGRIGLLASMALLQVAAGWIILPDIPNHRLFTALVGMTICLGLGGLVFIRGKVTVDCVWAIVRPAIQWLLVTLYLFAALAKFNVSYLFSTDSCAIQIYSQISQALPLPQGGPWYQIAVWSSLIVELGLPIALLLRRSRRWAILVGLAFHFILALDSQRHFSDFSAVATAALLCFGSNPILTPARRRLLATLLLAGATLSIWFGGMRLEASWSYDFVITRNLLWSFYGALLVESYIRYIYGASSSFHSSTAGKTPVWLAIMVRIPLGLAIINGLTPYLGIKTKSAWDMYSNLQVINDRANHILIPHSLDLLGQLSAPIRIVSSTNQTLLGKYRNSQNDIVPFELIKIFKRDPSGRTTFIWRGALYSEHPHHEPVPNLPTIEGWWAHKLLSFRPVDQNPDPRCLW